MITGSGTAAPPNANGMSSPIQPSQWDLIVKLAVEAPRIPKPASDTGTMTTGNPSSVIDCVITVISTIYNVLLNATVPSDEEGFGAPAEDAEELKWLFDTGADNHFCCKRYMFSTYTALDKPRELVGVGGTGKFWVGIGTVPLVIRRGHRLIKVELQDVIHVPEKMEHNLIGVPVFTEMEGHCFYMDKYVAGIVYTDPSKSKKMVVLSGYVESRTAWLDYCVTETVSVWGFEQLGKTKDEGAVVEE